MVVNGSRDAYSSPVSQSLYSGSYIDIITINTPFVFNYILKIDANLRVVPSRSMGSPLL
jgi:hypothetical protein